MIVHATLEHPNQRWGGIGAAVDLMCRGAAQLGLACGVVSPAPETIEQLAEPTRDMRVSIPGVASPGDVYRSKDRIRDGRLLALAMAHLIAETCGSADVVIHNEELLPLAEEWLEWGRGRVLYFSHGLSSQEHPDTPALVELQHELARLPVPVCAPSPAQAQIARHVLGRPVEPLRLPLALLPQREPRLGAIRRGVIAAGRFVPQKGFDLLIRALGKLDERPRCTIVGGHGDTQYERECRMLASECEVEVNWRDWTTHEELTEMLVLSALLAVPSRFEPLGLIAAEAIAVHTPVVGFRVGGLAHLLRAAGQPAVELTDEDSAVAGLAETIRRMVNDPPQVSGSALQHWDAQAMVTDLERSFAGGGPQW